MNDHLHTMLSTSEHYVDQDFATGVERLTDISPLEYKRLSALASNRAQSAAGLGSSSFVSTVRRD